MKLEEQEQKKEEIRQQQYDNEDERAGGADNDRNSAPLAPASEENDDDNDETDNIATPDVHDNDSNTQQKHCQHDKKKIPKDCKITATIDDVDSSNKNNVGVGDGSSLSIGQTPAVGAPSSPALSLSDQKMLILNQRKSPPQPPSQQQQKQPPPPAMSADSMQAQKHLILNTQTSTRTAANQSQRSSAKMTGDSIQAQKNMILNMAASPSHMIQNHVDTKSQGDGGQLSQSESQPKTTMLLQTTSTERLATISNNDERQEGSLARRTTTTGSRWTTASSHVGAVWVDGNDGTRSRQPPAPTSLNRLNGLQSR